MMAQLIIRHKGKLLLVLLVLVGLTTAVVLLRTVQQQLDELGRGQLILGDGSANLSTPERLYLQRQLSQQLPNLQQPASRQHLSAQEFTINSGETARQIATNLANAGLLDHPDLFLDYARYQGYDGQLAAGRYRLQPGLTIPQLAQQLTQVVPLDVTITILAGWRQEEIVDYLRVIRPAAIDPDRFQALVERRYPFDLRPYAFLASHTPEKTLEGYLFPGSYTIAVETTAEQLLDRLLTRFGENITPTMRQAYGQAGLSLHEAISLAAIVQREALLAEEQPLIAGVFLNRLAIGMPLQADPTVQYALGYDATRQNWWKSPLSLADLRVQSPYNTYVINGLPPNPIANPGLGALTAVANPTPSNYLFFVANCGLQRDGGHNFSATFEEHLAKVNACQ